MSTPAHIATTLQAAGWEQVSDENWQRPVAHPDVHSWAVADLIQRTDEPRHAPPPTVGEPKPRKPGFQMRGSHRPARSAAVASCLPRPVGKPRKAELIQRVAIMHDVQRMTFRAIAAEIGGKASRVFYLYRQVGKLAAG